MTTASLLASLRVLSQTLSSVSSSLLPSPWLGDLLAPSVLSSPRMLLMEKDDFFRGAATEVGVFTGDFGDVDDSVGDNADGVVGDEVLEEGKTESSVAMA